MKISVVSPGNARVAQAVERSDLILVCADPAQLKPLRHLCEELGRGMAEHDGAPVIVLRASLPPGTMRELVIPTLERASRKRAGEEFGVCINPDLPGMGTLIGELNRASGEPVAALYGAAPGPLVRTDIDSAEMAAHAAQAWQALKTGFANEIGMLSKALGIDAHKVLGLAAPGLAPGSSRAPQELATLLRTAKGLDLPLPIVSGVVESVALQVNRCVQAVLARGKHKVGLIGLPCAELAERLVGKGFDLRLYDAHGCPAHLVHLLLPTLDALLAHAETIVIGSASPEFPDLARRLGDHQAIIDLARACDSRTIVGVYEGLCW